MFKVSLGKSFQVFLMEATGKLTAEVKTRIESAVSGIAQDTYAQAKVMALQKLDATAQQYIDNLVYEEIAPGIHVIKLKAEAAHLDTGFPEFDMKPGLLKNAKKVSKAGYKYRSIPMEQKGQGKAGTTRGDMLSDLRSLRKVFGDTGITKSKGQPLLGKVFSVKQDGNTGNWNASGLGSSELNKQTVGPQNWSKNISGVTKYQYTLNGKTRSQFIVFRTVSANPKSKDKFWHPGFNGVKIFPQLEQWAINQIEKRIREEFD